MTSTLTAPSVAPPPCRPAVEPPAVTATAYLPLPGFTLTTIITDHSRTCGHWHRHVSARLDDDDLIRYPPCGGGRYRLDLTGVRPPLTRAHVRTAS